MFDWSRFWVLHIVLPFMISNILLDFLSDLFVTVLALCVHHHGIEHIFYFNKILITLKKKKQNVYSVKWNSCFQLGQLNGKRNKCVFLEQTEKFWTLNNCPAQVYWCLFFLSYWFYYLSHFNYLTWKSYPPCSLGSYLTKGFCPLFFQFYFLSYFTQSFPIRYWIFNVASLTFIIFYLLPSSLNIWNVWNVTIVKEKVKVWWSSPKLH